MNPTCDPRIMARNTQLRDAADFLLRIIKGEPLPEGVTIEAVIAFTTLLLAQTARTTPPAPLGY